MAQCEGREMMPNKRTFTAREITQAAKVARENWDFSVLDRGDEYKKAYRAALEITESQAEELWCEDGPMVLDTAFSDVWDFLDEFARNTADNSI